MGLVRIIMHWTAGGNRANSTDKRHYHEIIEGDGARVEGDHLPEANISTSDGRYAAHTRRFNRGSIGLSMAGMNGARQAPFSAGNAPITQPQLDAFASVVAEYADTYDIEISRESVLTHAEVQLTHRIPQRGKWDITWLPGMESPGHPIDVGDVLRRMVKQKQASGFLQASPIFENADVDGLSSRLAQNIAEALRDEMSRR